MPLVVHGFKEPTEVERAFARAKADALKAETRRGEWGIVYHEEFNHYVAAHPHFIPQEHLNNLYGVYIRRTSPLRSLFSHPRHRLDTPT